VLQKYLTEISWNTHSKYQDVLNIAAQCSKSIYPPAPINFHFFMHFLSALLWILFFLYNNFFLFSQVWFWHICDDANVPLEWIICQEVCSCKAAPLFDMFSFYFILDFIVSLYFPYLFNVFFSLMRLNFGSSLLTSWWPQTSMKLLIVLLH